jgi:lipoprotein-releasing system permease protein
VSPPFATALRFSALGLGGVFALVGAYGLVFASRRAPPEAFMRQRSAVTQPTFISIVGVAVGLWALIVVLGVMHGLQSDLREKILRTNAHLMVDPASPSGSLEDTIALERAIRALPEVVEANAYVRGDVMVSSPSGIAPNVVIKGMVPEQLIASDQLRGRLVAGTFDGLNRPEHLVSDRGRYPTQGSLKRNGRPPDDDRYLIDLPHDVFPGILIGAELARQLNVEVGDELQLISPDGDVGPTGLRPKLASFRVSGVFMTGMYEYDQKLGYVALDAAQRFLDLGRERNAIEARLSDPAFVDEVAPRLRELLAKDYPTLTASTFQERNKSLFAALALERLVMFVVLGFIILVAGLLIVVSLVMLVVEKVREVAVLKALGAANGTIVKSFVSIGAFIGFFGILAGVPLGIGTCLLLMYNGIVARKEFYIQTLPVKLEAFEIILFALAAMAICLLATVYPALRASRLRPVDGLRHG